MILRIHKKSKDGIDYILMNEATDAPLELFIDGSLPNHWAMSEVPNEQTLRNLAKGFYNGQPLTRNAGSEARNEGWLITVVADESVQALYQAGDSDAHRGAIEKAFLATARKAVGRLEQDGVNTRRGHKAQLFGVGKLERMTRDGRPLLHYHVLVMNFGRSLEDGRFEALNFRQAYYLQHYHQTALTKEFAYRLTEQFNFKVSRNPRGGISIRGVTQEWLKARMQGASQKLEAFKAKVGTANQKVIDRFNRFTRTAKQAWSLGERFSTWRQQGQRLGLYLKDLPKRSLRYINEKQTDNLSLRYVKRAIRWESNQSNLINQRKLTASALIEAIADERVNEASICKAIDRVKQTPARYGVEIWTVKEKPYFVLKRNGVLLNHAFQSAADMVQNPLRKHRIPQKHLHHLHQGCIPNESLFLMQAASGERLSILPPKYKSVAQTLAEYYGKHRGYRVMLVGKHFKTLPKGVAGEYVTVENFIKRTQPKRFLETFLRVRHYRLHGPHHTAGLMEKISKPDWKLNRKTTVVVDPAQFRAGELNAVLTYLERRRCKVVLLADTNITSEIQNRVNIRQDPSINMGMKL